MFSAMLSTLFSLVFCVLRHVRRVLIDDPHLKAPKSQRSCRCRTSKPGPNHHHLFKGGLPVLCWLALKCWAWRVHLRMPRRRINRKEGLTFGRQALSFFTHKTRPLKAFSHLLAHTPCTRFGAPFGTCGHALHRQVVPHLGIFLWGKAIQIQAVKVS